MKTKKWYQIVIHYPYGDSILEHKKRSKWRLDTARKHALDISRTWAVEYSITIQEV